MNSKTIQAQTEELFSLIDGLSENKALLAESALPSGSFFLNSDDILSLHQGGGDARYPYSKNGMTLWAYTSGNMKMEESVFHVLLPAYEGQEPNLACFAGLDEGEGFVPISMTGTARQPLEKDVERYTVFTPEAVFYLTRTSSFTAAARLFVDGNKCLRISLFLRNISGKPLSAYLSLYADFLMTRWAFEQDDAKYFKYGKVNSKGYLFHTFEGAEEHFGAVVRSETKANVLSTTSRRVYTGSVHNQLNCSVPLFTGEFSSTKSHTEGTETAILGDLIPLSLNAGESFSVTYTCAFCGSEEEALSLAGKSPSTEETDSVLFSLLQADKTRSPKERRPEFVFDNVKNFGSDKVFNSFLKTVTRQVEFCARAKNYVGPFVGIRDIFQQLEASLFWIPDYSRGKIIEAISYLGDDGRAPRQYSYPTSSGALPAMDLRPFIDQGVWIISTVYTYLAHTGDYSILDERCGYYHYEGYKVSFSSRKDTVLDHLLAIADYLISNLAPDTGCLRVLFGDWNDAVDGLGRSDDKSREFGNGVSVMASLQFYKNLTELISILEKIGKKDRIEEFKRYRSSLKEGLLRYAIETGKTGEKKVVHGWADNLRFKVGSFSDNDGMSRDSVTSNAFWFLSDIDEEGRMPAKDILAAYDRLDSKYGLKTFEPYFPLENKEVGRVIYLPKGFAENGATYIHATLFAVMSLFHIGESERAWEQLHKVLPITHGKISVSPFVMPNSYVFDEERGYDGESMSDWFTGSGCVLVKILVWYVFGIRPDLDGVTVCPAASFPAESARASVRVKGANVTVTLRRGKHGRAFLVNGVRRASVYDEKSKAEKIYLPNEELERGDVDILIEA